MENVYPRIWMEIFSYVGHKELLNLDNVCNLFKRITDKVKEKEKNKEKINDFLALEGIYSNQIHPKNNCDKKKILYFREFGVLNDEEKTRKKYNTKQNKFFKILFFIRKNKKEGNHQFLFTKLYKKLLNFTPSHRHVSLLSKTRESLEIIHHLLASNIPTSKWGSVHSIDKLETNFIFENPNPNQKKYNLINFFSLVFFFYFYSFFVYFLMILYLFRGQTTFLK